jgi:UDP-glucose 4-epimerase
VTLEWTGNRVLVTGGTGFLGQPLVRRLARLKAHVAVALPKDVDPAETAGLPREVERWDGDVRDYDQMRRLIERAAPGIIFHLAAVGVNDPFISEELALQVNLHGTLNLLRAAREGDVQRIVVAGTSYEYGPGGDLDPGNVYAASKVAAWAFCRMYYRAYGTPVVLARPFNVFGPRQNPQALIPAAIRAALANEDFPMTPGEQARDFIYVNDVIEGLLACSVADGVEGVSLDLGTGHALAVRDVVERVFALVEGRGKPLIGALPYRPGVTWRLVSDAERTTRLTGWRAEIGLDQGLQSTLQAFKNRWRASEPAH